MVSERQSPVGGQLVPRGPHGLHWRKHQSQDGTIRLQLSSVLEGKLVRLVFGDDPVPPLGEGVLPTVAIVHGQPVGGALRSPGLQLLQAPDRRILAPDLQIWGSFLRLWGGFVQFGEVLGRQVGAVDVFRPPQRQLPLLLGEALRRLWEALGRLSKPFRAFLLLTPSLPPHPST